MLNDKIGSTRRSLVAKKCKFYCRKLGRSISFLQMEGATSVGSILFHKIDTDNKSVIITSEQIATQCTNFKPIEQKK